jgi:hypothetical protein
MMNIFSRFLRRSREIAIGSQWVLKRTDGDPFPPIYIWPVKILDVKDGWVRFYFGPFSPDNRCKVQTFLDVYEPIEPPK